MQIDEYIREYDHKELTLEEQRHRLNESLKDEKLSELLRRDEECI